MPDISELILQVKNADNAVKEIDKVDKKLKLTASSAEKVAVLGKTIFAGWTFSRVIGLAKQMGDAYSSALVTTRKFEAVFGSFNKNAADGVKVLTERFHETERSAKDLIATIGARLDFGFDDRTLGKVSADLARISQELASFYGKNVTDVSLKLTQALAGQTRGLKEYGINIDINSEKFKQLSQQIKDSTNSTESGARALAIYTSILNKVRSSEGTFETQAKSISQLLNDIGKAFTDGPLAQAGKMLSDIFGPILKVVAYLVQSPIGSAIGGLVIAITELLVSIKLLKVAGQGLLLLTGAGGLLTSAMSSLKMKVLQLVNLFTIGTLRAVRSKWTFENVLRRLGKTTFVLVERIFFNTGALITKGIGKLLFLINTNLGRFFLIISKKIQAELASVMSIVFGAPIAGIGAMFKTIGALLIAGLVFIVDAFRGFKLTSFIIDWLSDVFEKVANAASRLLNGLSPRWENEVERQERNLKEYREKLKNISDAVSKINEEARTKLNELFESEKVYLPENAEKLIEESRKRQASLRKAIDENLIGLGRLAKDQKEYNEWYDKNKALIEEGNAKYRQLVIEAVRTGRITGNMEYDMYQAIKAAADNERAILMLSQERMKFTKGIRDNTNSLLAEQKECKRLEENLLHERTAQFEIFNWYQNAIEKIMDSMKAMTPIEKIKAIQARIDKFKSLYGGILFNPAEARAKYKEYGELETQKFEAEMDALNLEKQYLESTNEMIKKYVEKAMEWKSQGVDAIEASSAEGYKFLTSGFSNLSHLGPILENQGKENSALQQKANTIAEGSKKVLEGIKSKIDKINPNATGIKFEIFN